jgi:hypothetical protein
MRKPPKSIWRRALFGGVLAMTMAGVVWLYQRPDMLVMLSEQLWACF